MFVHLFDMKSAPRIFRKSFDRESPNFAGTSISIDIVYSHTGYDVIAYFRSEVIAKKLSKIQPPTASGGISREGFKIGLRNLTCLLDNLPHKCAGNDVTRCFWSAAQRY